MPIYSDQTGRDLRVENPPQRIISLVPSLSELLCDLGLQEKLVGVTKFCVHPKSLTEDKEIIGGTKNFRFETIAALQPDLIIANKEENTLKSVERLEKIVPVYVSDIATLADLKQAIDQISQLCDCEAQGQKLRAQLKDALHSISEIRLMEPVTCAYLIWKDPIMIAGHDTFISEMLGLTGFRNVAADLGERGLRYPKLEMEELRKLQPDIIFLSSEPFPFKDGHTNEIEEATGIKTIMVDGEPFSWYGSRIIHSLPYIHQLMHELRATYR